MYQPTPPRKRHILRWVLTGIAGFFVLIIIVTVAAGCGSKPPHTAVAQPATSSDTAAPAEPVAAPATSAPATAPTAVEFHVSGTGGPSIMYGSSSDHRSGGGTLGSMSDGNSLPWHTSIPFDPNAMYYSLNAQLEGGTGGILDCSIVVTGPGMEPLTVSHGHAQGGYNVCSAQAAPNADGTSWQNES